MTSSWRALIGGHAIGRMIRPWPDRKVSGNRREPASEEMVRLYREESEDSRKAAAREGLWIGVVVYMLFSITDLMLIPDVAVSVIICRTAVSVVSLTVLEVLLRAGRKAIAIEVVCAIAIVSAYAGWLVPALGTVHARTFSYYMVYMALFMMSANLFFSFRFGLSLVTSLVIAGIFFVALGTIQADNSYRWALGVFSVSCLVFTSYVNWRLNQERFKVFLNAHEARIRHHEATERGTALLKLSRTDPLTGLENRRAIDEKLREYWNGWRQAGRGFAAMLIDVDFFKRYNDYYGHQEGDRCLVRLGEALQTVVTRNGASIGRYGGEEFIVLAPTDDPGKVMALAELIRSTVQDLGLGHDQRRDGTSVVTVSAGVAITRDRSGTRLEKIIHEADRALYLAKAGGRNCVHLFDPTDPQSSDESENIAALLKIAIPSELVSMVYQPIEDVETGEVYAVEALMRLDMLDGTSVPPSLFIPVAERTGAILELGRWAIETVCRDLLADSTVETVSVNVSPIQLQASGFADSVAAILKETGISGSRLAFEITEGLEMEVHSNVLRCIADLKRLGIRIWLDDFGTGFAGLSWLRLIDFDVVKVDRSFLHDWGTAKGRTMLRDIVSLVRNRGPRILIEGVETREQLQLARRLGIDHVQGYHVGMPVSAVELRRALSKGESGDVLRSA